MQKRRPASAGLGEEEQAGLRFPKRTQFNRDALSLRRFHTEEDCQKTGHHGDSECNSNNVEKVHLPHLLVLDNALLFPHPYCRTRGSRPAENTGGVRVMLRS